MKNLQKNPKNWASDLVCKKSAPQAGDIWESDFLFEQYPDAILIVDNKGNISGVNKNLIEMLGYEKEEMLGNTIEMLLPESHRKSHVKKRNGYMNTTASNTGRPMETGAKFQARRKDGSCFPVDIMLSPSEDKSVTITVIRDISEKIATQENERKAREALSAIFDAAPVAIFSVGHDKRIISWSRAAENLFGYPASEIIGLPYEEFPYIIGKTDQCLALYNDAFAGKTVRNVHRFRRHKNGTMFDVSIDTAPMYDDEGNIYAITYSVQDISERIKAEKREKEANDTLKAVVDSAPIAIFVLDKNIKVLSWNLGAEQLFGFKAREVIGKPYQLIPPDEQNGSQQLSTLIDQVFHGQTVRNLQRKRIKKDGTLVAVEISAAPIISPSGEILSAAYCAQDITDRLAHEEQLNRLAYQDQLTKLPNRECLKLNLGEHFYNCAEPACDSLFVTKFCINGFAEVNNSFEHASADRLLIDVAQRLCRLSPDNSQIYRTDRYDFALAMCDLADPVAIMAIVKPILEQMSQPFKIEGQSIHLDIQAGLAIGPSHGKTVEELLTNASLALALALADQSQNIKLFDMSMKARVQAKHQLDADLRRAFENDEFELFYQPQIRLKDNRLIGAEALLRWRRPDQGICQPGTFIDALGNSLIAYDVGNWIMQNALNQTANWKNRGLGNLRMGVNLFAAQFDNDTLIRDVNKALTMSGLEASALELEITENIAIGLKNSIIDPLKILRDKGVGIAFDDFGTGYASLSYLLNYPLTRIKIDRSFLEHIPGDEKETAIVHSIILMAQSLGLEVIAEGVETLAQESFLKQQNCEEVQGYYYAKPMPAAEFYKFGMDANAKHSDLICHDIAGAA
ncbi:MAG: EAL domain-containing protein [Devosiaceae bacterium]|nr:EAL domain-containing protein [Devosiaceae bacterium]